MYFVLLISVLTVGALLLTHRWAGAAFVLRNALDAMRRGDYSSRLKLRRTDYLKDVAARLSSLRDDLVRDREALQEGLDRVEAALARGDTDGATEMIRTLTGRQSTSEAGEVSTVRSRETSASPTS